MKRIAFFTLVIMSCAPWVQAQEAGAPDPKAMDASRELTREANEDLSEDDFVSAEANYRRAIAKSPENTAAPYNLGHAYYRNDRYGEAFGRFKEAGERAGEKSQKHKSYHNKCNVFMKQKDYKQAVEAYKEALRNDPTDEETRYNLALAKELLKKDQEQQKQDEENQEQEQEDQQEEEQQNQEQNEGDNGEQEQEEDQQQSGGEDEQEENREGDGDRKEEQDRKPEQNQEQPRPNQLSPQQIQNLLQAMENEEKKVKEKIDAQKVKGAPVKTEKDW